MKGEDGEKRTKEQKNKRHPPMFQCILLEPACSHAVHLIQYVFPAGTVGAAMFAQAVFAENYQHRRPEKKRTKNERWAENCCLARHSVLPLYISQMTIAHPAPKQTREDRKRTGYMLLSERKSSSSLLLDMASRASLSPSWFWIKFIRKIH